MHACRAQGARQPQTRHLPGGGQRTGSVTEDRHPKATCDLKLPSAHPRRMKENILIVELVLAVMVPPTGTVRDVAFSDGLVARIPLPFQQVRRREDLSVLVDTPAASGLMLGLWLRPG